MVSWYHVYVILYSTHTDVYYCVVLCKDSISFSYYVFMWNDYKTRMKVADH